MESMVSGWAGATVPWKLECESEKSRSYMVDMIGQARLTSVRTEKVPIRVFPWLILSFCLL